MSDEVQKQLTTFLDSLERSLSGDQQLVGLPDVFDVEGELMDDTERQNLIRQQLEHLAKEIALDIEDTKKRRPVLSQAAGFVSLYTSDLIMQGTALPIFLNEDHIQVANLLKLVAPTTQKQVEDIFTVFESIGVSIQGLLMNSADLATYNSNLSGK